MSAGDLLHDLLLELCPDEHISDIARRAATHLIEEYAEKQYDLGWNTGYDQAVEDCTG